MADISKITLPNGNTYDIKDATARASIAGGVSFLGVSTTAITDGGTEKPTIDGTATTPTNGNLVIYDGGEYIFTGTYGSGGKWAEFGDLSTLGDLAYKDSASGSFTPHGTVTQPTFSGTAKNVSVSGTPNGSVSIATGTGTANYTPTGSVSAPTISVATAGSTTTVKNPTKVTVAKTVATALPTATAPANEVTWATVSNETLTLYKIGYTTGDSITTSNVTVKTGDASYNASAPTFDGDSVELKATFTGSNTTMSGSYTPEGTVTQPTFNGTAETVTVS